VKSTVLPLTLITTVEPATLLSTRFFRLPLLRLNTCRPDVLLPVRWVLLPSICTLAAALPRVLDRAVKLVLAAPKLTTLLISLLLVRLR
jgi:hypothetical protein